MTRRVALVLALCVQLSACFIASDGILTVRMEIVDETDKPYDECEVGLMYADSKEVLQTNNLYKQTETTFRVSPYKNVYLVEVSCRGGAETARNKEIIEATFDEPDKVHDIGRLIVRRE